MRFLCWATLVCVVLIPATFAIEPGATHSAPISGGETIEIPFDGELPLTASTPGLKVLDASLLVTVSEDDETELHWRFTLKHSRKVTLAAIYDLNGAQSQALKLQEVDEGRVRHYISSAYKDPVSFLEQTDRELFVFRIEAQNRKGEELLLHQGILVENSTKLAILDDLESKGFIQLRP
jgi:hypothetical protein